jgi:Uma2 family endonuclease
MMQVTHAAKRLPTFDELYAQIEALPEGVTGEILRPGVVSTMSRPGMSHADAAEIAGHLLRSRFDPRFSGRGWWIHGDVEIRLPGDLLAVPDLSGWRTERVARLPDENPIRVMPDWCAEVLSPSTGASDRVVKLPLYARCGIGHVWVIDPHLRVVEVYETVHERPTLVASARDDEVARLPPFDAELAVGGWWRAAEAAGAR